MYCKHCGSKLRPEYIFCSHCGARRELLAQKPADDKTGGFWLLGFLVPVVGLILYALMQDERPARAKAAGVGALVGGIIGVVSVILIFVLYFVLIGAMIFSL